MFSAPQVNIYSEDVVRAVEFYRRIGFEETFRTPSDGPPIHVELRLDGFTVGIAAVSSAVTDHGLDLDLGKPGRGMEIALWTEDPDSNPIELVQRLA